MHARILYVVGQLRAGGLERQLDYLLRTMNRKRYAPAVAVWNFREDDFYVGELRELGVPIYHPPPLRSKTSKLRWLRNLAKQLAPQVIHSYSFYTNFAAWYAARGTNAIAVGSVQSDFFRARKDSGFLLGRLSARWPASQVFNSIIAAEAIAANHDPFTPRKVLVVHNALDLERFASTPLPKSDRHKIIGIGSLAPVKRWDLLLQASARLKREGLDFLVRIAGDGPLRASLAEQAKTLGIDGNVKFLGQTKDIPALIADSTLLVHTSDSEGRPNVVMEAMACGRPVVATDVGDTRALIDDGKTGFLVPKGDDAALAQRIAALLRNAALCELMGEAARSRAESEFNLDRLVDETLAAYRAAGWRES